jgi:predicted Zn-dependent peptidase
VGKEVDVILDEINACKDNPSELIFDEFENILFDGHALGHPILGDEASILRFTPESGRSFTRRYYVPSNMVFFSTGRMRNFARLVRSAGKALEDIASVALPGTRRAPVPGFSWERREKKETHQSHVLIGGRSCNLFDDRRTSLFLLNNILGGPGMNSRLNVSLREKHGLVYHVESSVVPYTDTGVTTVYFGTDPRHLEKALRLALKEIRRLREVKLSGMQLAAAKKQLTGQLGVAGDNKESLFLGLGKSFLHYGQYETLPEIFAVIDRVTASDLLDVANEVFAEENLSRLIYE